MTSHAGRDVAPLSDTQDPDSVSTRGPRPVEGVRVSSFPSLVSVGLRGHKRPESEPIRELEMCVTGLNHEGYWDKLR